MLDFSQLDCVLDSDLDDGSGECRSWSKDADTVFGDIHDLDHLAIQRLSSWKLA